MFDGLKRWVDRRARQNATVIDAAKIFEQILRISNSPEPYQSIVAIRKAGKEEELRKWFLKTVASIVTAEVPMLAMRRELMENVRSNLASRLLFSEELYPRREEIYRHLNESGGMAAEWNTDEFTQYAALWSDCQSICLRHIQNSAFEKTGPDDWWTGYVKMVELETLALYRCMLDESDELSRLLLKACKEALKDYERRIEEGAPTATVPAARATIGKGDDDNGPQF